MWLTLECALPEPALLIRVTEADAGKAEVHDNIGAGRQPLTRCPEEAAEAIGSVYHRDSVPWVIFALKVVIGGIWATALHGVTIDGMFRMMTVARGVVGFDAGGEYLASSRSASEPASDLILKHRGPAFIMVSKFLLSFGGPFAVSIFLTVLMACPQSHYSTYITDPSSQERTPNPNQTCASALHHVALFSPPVPSNTPTLLPTILTFIQFN
ncbi:uncharacterized protein N7482_000600 [Penicillium canariense]|uniref:Uncharacterized protein n=1 Tax=Penicillium canariense TaxID=189055 RepID=A0A9W9LS57_9EURO|nr:uncharacterized protein N7482_000600 [Penicillium canariense]KAJ5174723.1 hypothetical protein N7482_000600 [Penicillium canariense]